MLCVCCRIANLKEELEASRQRLEDEQQNEAQLARRAQALEEEAKAAGRQLQQVGVDASDFPSAAVALPEGADAAAAFPVGWSTPAAPAAQEVLAQAAAAATGGRSRWAALMGSADDLSPSQQQQQQQARSAVEPQGAPSGAPAGPAAYEALDLSAVTKHVEEMAAQYVEKLSLAEAEVAMVRSVWKQAEDDLAALRSSPRTSSADGGSPRTRDAPAAAEAPGSPRLMTADGRVGRQDFELLRVPPGTAPQDVSGSSHAAAETEHGTGERIAFAIELPSPVFGGGPTGRFGEAPGSSGREADSGVREAAAAAQSPRGVPVVAAAAATGVQAAPGAERYTAAVEQMAALQRAAQVALSSSSPSARVRVRMVPEAAAAAAAADSSFSSANSSRDDAGSDGSCGTDLA